MTSLAKLKELRARAKRLDHPKAFAHLDRAIRERGDEAPVSSWACDYQVGDTVMWPDGSESRIVSINYEDGAIMDGFGTWHPAYDVEEAGQQRAYGAAALSALVVSLICIVADRMVYGLMVPA